MAAFGLAVTGLMVGQSLVAPEAQALPWTTDAPGVDTVGATTLANPSTLGSVVAAYNNQGTPSMIGTIDNNTLYGIDAGSPGNTVSINTNTALTTQLWATRNTAGIEQSTLAMDGGGYGARTAGEYTWYWGQGNNAGGCTNNTRPVYYWQQGASAPTAVYCIPSQNYFNAGGLSDPYFSGGGINQVTGQLYFSTGECNTLGSTTDPTRLAIFDPATMSTYWSGPLQPATSADAIFTGVLSTACGGNGYVASGMALDALGNFYLLVNGVGNTAIPADAPYNTTGQVIPAGNGYVSWLVKVVPSFDNQPWKYQIVTSVWNGVSLSNNNGAPSVVPGTAWPNNFFQTHHYGTAFLDGQLYVVSDSYLTKINPLTGIATYVGQTNAASGASANGNLFYDLGSTQTAMDITGTVYNDATATGAYSAGDDVVPGVLIGLYQTGGSQNYAAPTLIGSQRTNASGQYNLLVPDVSSVNNAKYYVRMVQPQLDGVNAVQTFGQVTTSTQLGQENSATMFCTAGGYGNITGAGDGTTVSQTCAGTLESPYADPALGAKGSTAALSSFPTYAEVTMNNTFTVPEIDFGITTAGSYGDAPAGPDTVSGGAPMHVNGVDPLLWLGAKPGVYSGPSIDDSHTTDDGVYVDSYAGKISLANTVLASTKTYHLAGDVSGDSTGASVTGWTTGPDNNNWNSTAVWSPSITSGKAVGTYQPLPATTAGTPTIQMRVSASTVAATLPTNDNNEYQGSATAWTTPGEIEDYSYTVADSVYRPAAVTNAGSDTFTVAGAEIKAGTTPAVGPAVAVDSTTTTPIPLTATVPSPDWSVSSITVKDTETGAVLAQPTFTLSPDQSTASFSYTPTVGTDVVIEVLFTRSPDAGQSSLSLDTNTAEVGQNITATATVLDSDGDPLAGVPVTFTHASADVTVSDNGTCTTLANGKCSVTVSSQVAGVYPNEVAAFVKIGGADTEISHSPQSVTFTPGLVDASKSSFAVTPPVQSPDPAMTDWVVVGEPTDPGYTGILTARDAEGNLVKDLTAQQILSSIAFTASNAAVNVSAVTNNGDGTYQVTYTSTVASAATTASVAYGGTLVAQDPTAATKVTALPIPFAPGPPGPCSDPAKATRIEADQTTLSVGATSNITVYVTDKYCNAVADGTSVSVTATSANTPPSTTFSLLPAAPHTTTGGLVALTLTDSVVGTVNVAASVTGTTVANSPLAITFRNGTVDALTSSFAIEPPVDPSDPAMANWVAVGEPTGPGYTGILTAEDSHGNLVKDLTPSEITSMIAFGASSTAVSVSTVTNRGDGTYAVTYTSTVSSNLTTATVSYGGVPVAQDPTALAKVYALPIPFAPGPPEPQPTCDGTKLTASPTTLQARQTSNITAVITDQYCNPVKAGTAVTITAASTTTPDPGTAVLTVANNGLTDVNGVVTATLTDPTAEVVNVKATIQVQSAPAEITGSPQPVTFTPGDVDAASSSFAVTPVANSTDPAMRNWVAVSGPTGPGYTGVFTARDAEGNLVKDLTAQQILSDIKFTASAAAVNVSSIVNNGDGTYSVTYTSTVASAATTASVTYLGTPVAVDPTALTKVYALPIPFAPGLVDASASSFAVTPVVDPVDTDMVGWVMVGEPTDPGYTGVLTAKDAEGNLVADLTAQQIADSIVFSASSAAVVVSPVVTNNGDGTYSVTFTSTVASNSTTASVTYAGTPVAQDPSAAVKVTALPIPFAPGSPDANPVCPDPAHPGTNLTVDPLSLPVTEVSDVTAYVTDQYCNSVGAGTSVTFSIDPASPAVLTIANGGVTDSTGNARATLTDTKAEPVAVAATILADDQPTPIAGSPQTVTFTRGDVDASASSFAVTPVVDPVDTDMVGWVTVGEPTDPGYTGVLTAKDAEGNLVADLTAQQIADSIVFSASSAAVVVSPLVTNNGDGTYSVTFTSTVASNSTTASVTYAGTPVAQDPSAAVKVTALPIPFAPGSPDANPVCPDPAHPGTNLTADPTGLTVGGTSTVTAYVTDQYCNAVGAGTPVTITAASTATPDPGTAVLVVASGGLTDDTGNARATLTDTTAETVNVSATILVGDQPTPIEGSPVPVTFAADAIDLQSSTFTVSPVADPADPAEAAWVAVGLPTGPGYTGTLTAVDSYGNPLSDLSVNDIKFFASTANVAVSPSVVNNGDGTYSVTYTSTVAASDPTAWVQYQGHAVGAGPNGTVKPIPFKAGSPDVNPVCPDPAHPGTNLSADPTDLTVGGTSTITAYITDQWCNPVPGVPVSLSVASLAGGPGTAVLVVADGGLTDATGNAHATLTDTVAETVNVAATIPVDDQAVPIHGSPVAVTFAVGEIDLLASTFTVSPVADPADPAEAAWVAVGLPTGPGYTGTLTAVDSDGNPLSGLSVDGIQFFASSAAVAISTVVNNGDGTYSVTYTSTVAASDPTAWVQYQGHAVGAGPNGTVKPIPFKAGSPDANPVCPDPAHPGTHLSAEPLTLPVLSTSAVAALITDEFCNPVGPGVPVVFSVDSSAHGTLTVQGGGLTDAHGIAHAVLTDASAESVPVHATIAVNGVAAEIRNSPVTVTFTAVIETGGSAVPGTSSPLYQVVAMLIVGTAGLWLGVSRKRRQVRSNGRTRA